MTTASSRFQPAEAAGESAADQRWLTDYRTAKDPWFSFAYGDGMITPLLSHHAFIELSARRFFSPRLLFRLPLAIHGYMWSG